MAFPFIDLALCIILIFGQTLVGWRCLVYLSRVDANFCWSFRDGLSLLNFIMVFLARPKFPEKKVGYKRTIGAQQGLQ